MRAASVDTQIPVIDFSRFNPSDQSSLEALASEVDQALSGVGFMSVRHLGIDNELLCQVFEASRTFFSADESHKLGSAYRSASENFGYQGVGQENLDPSAPADLKETFTMRNVLHRPPDDARWPDGTFRDLMRAFYRECLDAAFRLMRVLTIALDLSPDFFQRYHSGENVTLRLLHYPSIEKVPEAGQLGAGAHTDYGLLTLLFQNDIGGLEVRTGDGEWQGVAASPQDVVINSGDLLEVWTNGRYRSTPHRVQPMSDSNHRQSIAMFVDPDSATEVAALPSCVSASNPARFSPTSAGRHLQERIEASHKARFEV
ncbi:MAG: 2OG-Fe(II) oxygenase family protein [Pseudomonadota bacterium]